MTSVENERLAIVETKVDSLQVTVGNLDTKLDTVVLYIAGEKATGVERRRESEFRRWLAPIVITVVNAAIGAASLIVRVLPTH